MIHPVKKVYVTQVFGANPLSYAKFGFKGHNGIDYRAFLDNGDRCYESGVSKIYAPHGGKVIENAYDADGYGYYLKIENDVEGSVLAHFHGKSLLAVGSTVKEGDFIATQGTTGNSTGIHLHWGYYRIPRDRSNGYGGMINQEPYLKNTDTGANMDEITKLKEQLEEATKQKEELQRQVNSWVADSKNGTWVAKADVEAREKAAYDKEFSAGSVSDTIIDMAEWEVNGLTVSTKEGDKTVSLNYKLK